MAPERPLVVITDETLLDEVLRLAAAAGCELHRAPDIVSARADWSRAPLIVLDELSLDREPPPRAGLLLVTKGMPEAAIWQRVFDLGIERVVPIPDREADLVSAFADVVEGPRVPGGGVIGVVGGRGGAGTSVFATALALTACDGARGALLLDCDPLGGGLDLLLGAETQTGARWPDLRLQGDRISMPALSEALPEYRRAGKRLPFLACGPAAPAPDPSALASVVDAGCRAGKVVVCDLPRHLGSDVEPVTEAADLIVMVVPAEVRACAAARQVAARLSGNEDRVRLVVRGPSPGAISPQDIATAVGLPLLTSITTDRHLPKSVDDAGLLLRPRSNLTRAARLALSIATAGRSTATTTTTRAAAFRPTAATEPVAS
ncbi:helicase [Amycolatopsis sp. K13G38]|uniref:Helicase n=1 Tax=Amycolatopsis acididurans TaxID=2724524 RepID=A0ABX1JHH9_9PSEU|nr:septum site-determining protein Ssd [Amycolatopsis acididurans]NKQ59106.1 helicase [Amycolatopsis acididurans]